MRLHIVLEDETTERASRLIWGKRAEAQRTRGGSGVWPVWRSTEGHVPSDLSLVRTKIK